MFVDAPGQYLLVIGAADSTVPLLSVAGMLLGAFGYALWLLRQGTERNDRIVEGQVDRVDRQLAEERAAHAKELAALREAHAIELAAVRADLRYWRDQRDRRHDLDPEGT